MNEVIELRHLTTRSRFLALRIPLDRHKIKANGIVSVSYYVCYLPIYKGSQNQHV